MKEGTSETVELSDPAVFILLGDDLNTVGVTTVMLRTCLQTWKEI